MSKKITRKETKKTTKIETKLVKELLRHSFQWCDYAAYDLIKTFDNLTRPFENFKWGRERVGLLRYCQHTCGNNLKRKPNRRGCIPSLASRPEHVTPKHALIGCQTWHDWSLNISNLADRGAQS